ncbi:MAG: patatin-like phospholipase family protein [Pseudomonadota bacterium]
MAIRSEKTGVKARREKLGIAFSGGGLRASFFHIGVLAQMARQGLLREVEVISTVSGGSIIGALYYLHVKGLLESKSDSDVTDGDYVEIIKRIELDFLKAVENNIRMLTFADSGVNLRVSKPDYSRSDRIAELYDELIYQSVLSNVSTPAQMRELKIFPRGSAPDFHPRKDNAQRRVKVPILILNATTLNSGRNWHFTAQTMGEPRTPENDEIDRKIIRLRRPRPSYDNMVERQQDFSLGHAVAASACVPGIFPPFSISDLYRDGDAEIRVQLVDGGVHDNQGIEGLLYEDCTCFVVSDAAVQMDAENQPPTGSASVLLRTSSVLMDRVRTEGLRRLMETKGKQRVAFMHLREGLMIRQLAWINEKGDVAEPVSCIEASSQDFGVDPQVQEKLASLRTDLDSFTEVEAYSLMLDAYLMSDSSLSRFRKQSKSPEIRGAKAVDVADWAFLKIAPWMKNPSPEYLKQLDVAGFTFGKPLFLIPWLAIAVAAIIVLLVVAVWPWLTALLTQSVPIYLILLAILFVVSDYFLPRLAKIFRFVEFLRAPVNAVKRVFGRVLIPFLGAYFVKFYLKFIDPLFLSRGRFEEFKRRSPH